ncbi:hypothetical protein [Cryptosporangium sp. NPDC051539]|uniref:hypothetical protein n=1 Tax=Cryptosporangium sp. NPDC051539 TaxID=3363962 RepID=UPI0037BB5EE2
MRRVVLYARSRRAPVAAAAAAGAVGAVWGMAAYFSGPGQVSGPTLTLTVLLLVAVVTATLGGPDDALDRTAAAPWRWLRTSHLCAALLLVLGLLLVTLLTGTRFGPTGAVVRDAAGLLGLTALGAAVAGAGRSWFLPLGWTLAATVFPAAHPAGEALTWPAQPADSRAAAVVAAVLAVAGFAAYVTRGPLPRAADENP